MIPTVTVVTPWRDCLELIPAYNAAMEASGTNGIDRAMIVNTGSAMSLRLDDFPYWEGRYSILSAIPAKGFSTGSNLGLRTARTDAVCFLNNDVVHTRPDWLAPIRDALRPGRLVGAKLVTDEHTRVDGRLFPYLEGWCLAGMRDDLLTLGGWDESLEEPAYFGDNLLSLKARQAGMKLVQVDVGLRHLSNYTSKRDVEGRERASAANRERFLAAARASMKGSGHASVPHSG